MRITGDRFLAMSMTLVEMASLITTELGVYDDTSLVLTQSVSEQEYKTLWDKYPWGDATGHGTVQVLAGISIVNYPAGMDRVITVRASQGATGVPPATMTG